MNTLDWRFKYWYFCSADDEFSIGCSREDSSTTGSSLFGMKDTRRPVPVSDTNREWLFIFRLKSPLGVGVNEEFFSSSRFSPSTKIFIIKKQNLTEMLKRHLWNGMISVLKINDCGSQPTSHEVFIVCWYPTEPPNSSMFANLSCLVWDFSIYSL